MHVEEAFMQSNDKRQSAVATQTLNLRKMPVKLVIAASYCTFESLVSLKGGKK